MGYWDGFVAWMGKCYREGLSEGAGKRDASGERECRGLCWMLSKLVSVVGEPLAYRKESRGSLTMV